MMVKAGDVGSCTMEPPALMLAPLCTTWGPLVLPGIVLVLSSKGWPLTAVMVVEGPSGATEGGLVDMKSVTCSGGVSGYSNGLFLQSGEELCFKLVSVVAAAVLFACAAAEGEVM